MQDLSLEKAVELLKEHCHRVTAVEEVPLLSALGRILAEDYVAAFDNPPFDRSPLDGYTFVAGSTAGHSAENPATFKIIGEECAGDFFDQAVPAGSALRIMTGGAIPKGCNCVVRQEDVTAEGDKLTVPFSIEPYTNYCYAGEDIKQGTKLAKKGTKLTAAHIGVLASQGFATVKVLGSVRVAIASTGDELLQPGQPLAPGKIYNSNLYLLASRLQELGFNPEIVGILPDDVDEAAKVIAGYKDRVDVFLTTGGVSVGKKDIMHGVVEQVGTRLFWRVSMKPGGPALAYTMGETLGIALSGNPFAAYATFELIAVPILSQISGNEKILPERMQAVLTDAFPKESRGRRFIRGYYENGKVRLPEQHASGSLFSVVGCNAFVDIPAGTGKLAKETEVDIVRLYRVK
ncbi:molybdopterin molybdotransferase MoeA [Selenomonas ruminantium]|uniref:Molybdopterin molybdenumtransferase n=1 Tax=Selenomonas ruminantium TaxID=971 RepID=A0A1H0QUS5_SELRU|nr:molybdopterin molybdotransferase MoeA [Selenomonas ruminantium]SDP20885.1 molybdopterin molybdotransferase [Selenomonas ruminantium]